ncbi:MAG: CobD/CbiB family protein [Methylophilaceae bacterium]|uniref:CobD/CbiB family protein n=1 Tax=Methylovorus sp. MM2 TaxID=1848038 RepID=UPI0007DFD9DB|nr:CobD/CbiB family protein [Methylovorus sp. MM2]OAM52119.1 adenosylcobinamide-phosphate synthase [Methylovorus sp. MM2]
MNFIALIGALALTYYRPHTRPDWLKYAFLPYAQLIERNFNGGKKLHGVIAWVLGVFLPVVLVGFVYFILLEINSLLGILFGVVSLYLTLRFSYFSQHAEKIAAALSDRNIDQARYLLHQWELAETDNYTSAEVARISIETGLRRSHQGLFAPIFWFVLLGPAGALLYRLTHLQKLEWPAKDQGYHQFAHQVFEWLDWLPTRITASCFAIVGDFEDAVYCWRTQADQWPDKALGIILASGAGALGVRLGEPLAYRGVLQFRPEMGLGSEADADYLRSAVGLVWRVLVLIVALVLLLTFAHWLGN